MAKSTDPSTKTIIRETWDRKVEYFLSMLGWMDGLENLWRFPYICMRNGGGIGIGMLILCIVVALYYNMIIAWTLYYIGNSFVSPLPWTTCNNEWNSPCCVEDRGYVEFVYDNVNITSLNRSSYHEVHNDVETDVRNGTLYALFNRNCTFITAQEDFWQERVLQMSRGIEDLGNVNWPMLLCLLGAWIIVGACIIKGVKSVGKQLRDERRREQKRKWKQKQKKADKIYSQSAAAVLKRKQREKEAQQQKLELEKRRIHKEKRQKRHDELIEKQRMELILKENVRRRKSEKQRRWREKKKLTMSTPVNDGTHTEYSFENKMSKFRAIKKLKSALPHTPVRRIATVKAYISCNKSPTVKALQRHGITPSPEEIKEIKMNKSVVEDIKSVIGSEKHKRCDKSREIVGILTASMSGPSVEKCKAKVDLAKKLGLPVSRGAKIRTKVFHSEQSSYQYIKRKTRSDKMSEETRKTIYDFWCSAENSRQTGNKKDVKRMRIGPKTYCTHEIQILEKTQSEVFLSFQQTYPGIQVSQRTFEKCKPYFVRAARLKDRTTCCCRYHLECRYIFSSFIAYRKQLEKDGKIDIDNFKIFGSMSELCEETMCRVEDQNAHLKDCFERNCSKCGIKCLKFSEEELSLSDNAPDLKWKKFEYIDIKTKHGTRKKLTLVEKVTKPGEMVENLKKNLQFFPGHSLRAKWQTDELKTLIENLPENECVTVHDFSENYRCSDMVEIQSNYFQRTEVSIHVSLIYRHAILEVDGVSSTLEDPNIICEHFYVISADEKHDQYYVNQVQKFIAEYLNSINYRVITMHEFCDGCQSQYKSRNCIGNLSESLSELGYSKMIRNYFESSHGKGPQDGAGGLLKNQADMAVIRGKVQIRSAFDLFRYAEAKLTTTRSHACKRRIFRYVEQIERDERSFQPIKGIRAIHRVETVDSKTVLLRNLSCYCDGCIDGEQSLVTCMNFAQVGSSDKIRLKSNNRQREEEDDDNTSVNQTETITNLISEGTIFAVLCDDEEHDFYLLKASSELETLFTPETDKWGASFPAGANIIRGLYFAKKKNSILTFKLLKAQPAIVPSASVLYICQDFTFRNNTLTLTEEENNNMLECVSLSELTQ